MTLAEKVGFMSSSGGQIAAIQVRYVLTATDEVLQVAYFIPPPSPPPVSPPNGP